nr:hypothetical protein [Rhodococcus wratislaviensis]
MAQIVQAWAGTGTTDQSDTADQLVEATADGGVGDRGALAGDEQRSIGAGAQTVSW